MPRRRKGETYKTSSSSSALMSTNIKEKPQQRGAANARERARMRVLSRAFCRLKTTLPWVPADTKLSKLDTLRLASSYIGHLKGILQDDPFTANEPLHPAINLTWPFGFNRGGGTGSSGRGGGSGSGSDEGEESDSNSDYWRDLASNSKDCIHLDSSSRYNPVPNANNANVNASPCLGLGLRHSSSIIHSHNHQQINTSDVSSGFESNGLDFL